MPVTSHEILQFAKDCIVRKDEVGFRNAIARAYYSAYHHVSPLMNSGPKASHQGLINYLKEDSWRDDNEPYDKRSLIAISYVLQSLKDQRVRADYVLDADIKELDADVAVRTAEKMIINCDAMIAAKAS